MTSSPWPPGVSSLLPLSEQPDPIGQGSDAAETEAGRACRSPPDAERSDGRGGMQPVPDELEEDIC